MKNSKQKKILKSLKILIFATAILITLIILLNKKSNLPYTDIPSDDKISLVPEYKDEQEKEIYPKNAYTFVFQYNKVGVNNIEDLYRKIYLINSEIVQLYEKTKGMNENELKSFYNNRKFEIGFGNFENFKKFINSIVFVEKESFDYAEFDIATLKKDLINYFECDLYYNYTGNNNIKLSFKVLKDNTNSEKYIIIFE